MIFKLLSRVYQHVRCYKLKVLLPGPLDQEKSSRSGWFETTYHWSSWAYNTSHADKHVARAWISFRYLSSYNTCPHWSVRTCIKIFLSYSVHWWKGKFHKAFRYWNISMYFCISLARTRSIYMRSAMKEYWGYKRHVVAIGVKWSGGFTREYREKVQTSTLPGTI